jgi:Mlc titration factor MtfA (ptsG expression regulator)
LKSCRRLQPHLNGDPLLAAVPLALLAWFVLAAALGGTAAGAGAGRAFPAAWREILIAGECRTSSAARATPAAARGHIQVFLDEKEFVGCAGQRSTTRCASPSPRRPRCLVLLNRAAALLPSLRQCWSIPALRRRARAAEPSGVLQETRKALSGESWVQGR